MQDYPPVKHSQRGRSHFTDAIAPLHKKLGYIAIQSGLHIKAE
ncbi:MAG: hypothetical protein VKJ46_03465 [Leptolyngbyaceae bacterium]|nr:hypothetical protein [Leptolyngbyaceae bacterium]